jgi:hypothetical protein
MQIKDYAAEFLSTLPINTHIREWEILHHSLLLPLKKGVTDADKWDMLLHTHYVDEHSSKIYVVIGVTLK